VGFPDHGVGRHPYMLECSLTVQEFSNCYMCMVYKQFLDNNFKIAVARFVGVYSMQITTNIFRLEAASQITVVLYPFLIQ
jgi:hypothetical protein